MTPKLSNGGFVCGCSFSRYSIYGDKRILIGTQIESYFLILSFVQRSHLSCYFYLNNTWRINRKKFFITMT